MAKNNKSVGKKKWIAGGVIGFASITLVATGFATWVVGNQVTSDEGNVNVTVDTAQNASVNIQATLEDSSLTIAEDYKEENDSKPVKVSKSDAKTPDFTITFSSITVSMGQAYYDSLTGLKLKFELAVPSEEIATDVTANNTVTTDLINKRDGDSFSYIEISSEDVEEDIYSNLPTSGNITYSLSSKSLVFTWSSFFEGKAPTDYYNGLIESKKLENNYDNLSKITEELNSLSQAFAPKQGQSSATLNIRVSLEPTFKDSSK